MLEYVGIRWKKLKFVLKCYIVLEIIGKECLLIIRSVLYGKRIDGIAN